MTFTESIQFVIAEAVRFVSPTGLAVEWIVVFFGAVLLCAVPLPSGRPLILISNLFQSVANRPLVSLLICALFPVLTRLLLLGIVPVPQPSIHDEFSHLLLADTLAHGRLANPTPPMWQHFESIHILMQPTYASMYPPAQGVFLAAGQVLFHQPWAGVELGIALMCASVYWMFAGWTSRSWALFGALLVDAKLGLTGFWVNSYMGGAVPAIGGALIVGALPRLRMQALKARHAVLFAIGAVILMNSRPFEGAVLTAVTIAFLLPSLLRKFRATPLLVLERVVLPAATILLLGGLCLTYYCWRVTGNPTQLPYQVNRATYGWPENLAFLPVQKVSIQNRVLRDMYQLEIGRRKIYDSTPSFLDALATRLFDNWAYLIGPALTIPLLFGFLSVGRKGWELILLLSVICILNLFQLVLYPYHLAPIIPVLYCLVALGSKAIYDHLRQWEPRRALFSVALLILCLSCSVALRQFGDEVGVPPSSYWERGFEWHRDARADVVDWLKSQPGKHLVMVHYDRGHPVNQEWVYNGADLNNSKILWAREVSRASDRAFIQSYRDRQPWLVDADVYPQRVIPYPRIGEGDDRGASCSPCQRHSSAK